MSENKEKNPFEGFKVLEGDTMAPDNVEIQEVAEVETVAEDTGIVDKTDTDETEKPIKEEKKEELSVDNLEIEYRDTVNEEEEEEEEDVSVKKESRSETQEEAVSDDEEVSQIGVLAKHLKNEGVIDFDEEDFEDSEDGLAKVVKTQIEKGVTDYKDNLDPVAQQFLDFIEDGGDPQHFTKAYATVDFSRIDSANLKGKSDLQKQIVAELMRREGYNREEIIDEIQDLLNGKVLTGRATRSLRKLQGIQKKERSELLETQKQQATIKQEKQETFLTELRENIDGKEEIAGFPISKKQKKSFYDYITRPDRKTGKTKLVMDSEADKDSQLKMAWLYFNDFNFEKVEKKARTKATSNLRANLERASGISRKKLKSKSRTKVSGDDMDFSLFSKAMKL
tara:strand:- start:586 stop:1770 length:1185 start_codon:yes stop_codon:yes gene_type:complete